MQHEVRRDGVEVELTPNEYKLLTTLARYPGRVYSRFELINHVQGYDYEGYERTIDAHVKNLRQKIEPDPKHPRYVETVFGVGYRLAKRCTAVGLRARLAAALVGVAVLAVGLATVLGNRGLEPRLEETAQARLERSAEHFAEVAASRPRRRRQLVRCAADADAPGRAGRPPRRSPRRGQACA